MPTVLVLVNNHLQLTTIMVILVIIRVARSQAMAVVLVLISTLTEANHSPGRILPQDRAFRHIWQFIL